MRHPIRVTFPQVRVRQVIQSEVPTLHGWGDTYPEGLNEEENMPCPEKSEPKYRYLCKVGMFQSLLTKGECSYLLPVLSVDLPIIEKKNTHTIQQYMNNKSSLAHELH